jgi:hypothetical protein
MQIFKNTLYFLVSISLFSSNACKDEKSISENKAKVAVDTFPHIRPNLEKQKKLTANYIAEN